MGWLDVLLKMPQVLRIDLQLCTLSVVAPLQQYIDFLYIVQPQIYQRVCPRAVNKDR